MLQIEVKMRCVTRFTDDGWIHIRKIDAGCNFIEQAHFSLRNDIAERYDWTEYGVIIKNEIMLDNNGQIAKLEMEVSCCSSDMLPE